MVVIGLFGVLLSMGLLMSMDVYRGTMFRSTREVLVSALTTARSRALANLSQSAYGVCYSAPDFIIFKGTSYSAGSADNETVPGNKAVTLASAGNFFTCGGGTGVVFDQLTGKTADTGSITVTGDGHPDETVSVNSEGAIIW